MSAFVLSPSAPREALSVRVVWDAPSPGEDTARPLRVATVPLPSDPWREDLRHRLEREVVQEASGAGGWSADVWHERQAAMLQQSLLSEFDAYTYEDLVELSGAVAADAILRAWSQREVIAVPVSGTGRFPGFQMSVDMITPGIPEAVAALEASGLRGWPAALWFTASNGWLADRRPVDVLAVDPAAVVGAARRRLERTPD